MFDVATILSFIGVSVLVILTPGPDVLFTITQGLTRGRKAGVTVAIGLALGNFVHTIGVALGLSLLFETSELAFWLLKVIGASYLVYLAYMSYAHRASKATALGKGGMRKEENLFRKGFIMNVLNPKVAIFFLAFLPRFANPERGLLPLQFVVLGSLFVILVCIVFGLLGYFAGSFGKTMMNNPRYNYTMSVVSALVFLGIAVSLLLY